MFVVVGAANGALASLWKDGVSGGLFHDGADGGSRTSRPTS